MTLDKILMTNIKSYLTQTQQKQTDLASHLDVQRQTVNKMLSGTRTITAVEFKKIAEFFGISMEKLFEDPEISTSKDVLEIVISQMNSDSAKGAIHLTDELFDILLRQKGKIPIMGE